MRTRALRGSRTAALALALALAACVPAGAGGGEDGDAASEPARETATEDEEERDLRENEAEAERATVRIRVTTCTGRRTGTGFHIGQGVIITNRHVIDGSVRATVTTWDGVDSSAETVSISAETDLAVLVTGTPPQDELELSSGEGRSGQQISVTGHPEGGSLTTGRGTISGLADGSGVGEAAQLLLLDIPLQPGNSGGPVIAAGSGQVVGVVFAQDGDREGRGLAISVESVRELLARPPQPVEPQECPQR